MTRDVFWIDAISNIKTIDLVLAWVFSRRPTVHAERNYLAVRYLATGSGLQVNDYIKSLNWGTKTDLRSKNIKCRKLLLGIPCLLEFLTHLVHHLVRGPALFREVLQLLCNLQRCAHHLLGQRQGEERRGRLRQGFF